MRTLRPPGGPADRGGRGAGPGARRDPRADPRLDGQLERLVRPERHPDVAPRGPGPVPVPGGLPTPAEADHRPDPLGRGRRGREERHAVPSGRPRVGLHQAPLRGVRRVHVPEGGQQRRDRPRQRHARRGRRDRLRGPDGPALPPAGRRPERTARAGLRSLGGGRDGGRPARAARGRRGDRRLRPRTTWSW